MYNIIKKNNGSIKIDTGFGPLEMTADIDGRVEIFVNCECVAITSVELLSAFIEAINTSCSSTD